MINQTNRAAIWIALAGFGLQVAKVQAAETVWRYLPQFPLVNASKGEWLDLDGDGINEMVINGASGITGVLKSSGDGLELVDIHADSRLEGRFVPVVDESGGASRLIVASNDYYPGLLQELAGIPLQVVRQIPFDFPVQPWAYGDIDGDGQPELIEFNPQASVPTVRLIDYVTGQVKWSQPVQSTATSLVVAQLDDDAPLEVVLAGSTPGLILSGDDGSVEWSYAPGFGWEVHVGRFQSDPQIGTFATRGTSTVVFRSQPYSPLYGVNPAPFAQRGAGTVYDVDGDGLDELFLSADLITPGFRAYKMGTEQLVGTWPSSFANGTAAAFGRLQPGSSQLLAYGANVGGATPPVGMEVKEFPSGDIVYHETVRVGPFNRVATADVDGDGQEETVVAIRRGAEHISGQSTVDLMVFSGDSEPDMVRHLADLGGDAAMEVADFDGGGAMDIVLTSGGRIVAVDGATLETRWERQATAQSDLAGLTSVAVTSADFDGDGVVDVALLMEDFEFGHRVVALSGLTGQTLWKSLAMPGVGNSRALLVAQIDGDPADEVVVTLGHTLHVFDTLSKQLEWVRPLDDWSATSAVLVQQSPNCLLGLVGAGTMRVIDCYTRILVDVVSLPSFTSFVHPVDAQGNVLLTEGDGRLYALKRVGGRYFRAPLSHPVGIQLSAVPDRMFPTSPAGQVIDVLLGTSVYPARLRVDLGDPLWNNGFEQ
jgi:outer membrane protein assembly factor BamB